MENQSIYMKAIGQSLFLSDYTGDEIDIIFTENPRLQFSEYFVKPANSKKVDQIEDFPTDVTHLSLSIFYCKFKHLFVGDYSEMVKVFIEKQTMIERIDCDFTFALHKKKGNKNY